MVALPHGGRGLKCICHLHGRGQGFVALPHGGRGLKFESFVIRNIFNWSPSPRRAWIEIGYKRDYRRYYQVALPTEGVD